VRIAIATGVLRVPPTYFVTAHAELLRDRHEVAAFALAADVRDTSLVTPIHDATPFRSLPFGQRMRAAPLFASAMTQAISAFRPDIVHQHFATWSGSARAAARASGTPLLTTVHGYDVFALLAPGRGALARKHRHDAAGARSASTRVLAVSEYLAGRAVEAGFDPSRLEVHYQGVDTDVFRPASAAPVGEPLLLFVGGLTEQKGVRDLVEASRRAHLLAPHRLELIGSGPLAAELRARTAGDAHIQVVGALDRDQVRERMRAATALILPSREFRGRREAAGLVLLEAQASGAPVIAYASGGTPEMMVDGSTGVLVPEGDRSALADSIRSLVGMSAGDLARMREAARAWVVAHRSMTRSVAELDAHYRALAPG
jgi:glycosyltransferase involved in cell wall biosynthesis